MIERNAHLDRKIGQEADSRREGGREKSEIAKLPRSIVENKSFTKHYLSERSFRAELPHGVIAIRRSYAERKRKRERGRGKKSNRITMYTSIHWLRFVNEIKRRDVGPSSRGCKKRREEEIAGCDPSWKFSAATFADGRRLGG